LGLGFRIQDLLGFGIYGSGFRVQDLRFRMLGSGLGFRVKSLKRIVWDTGIVVWS